tara:strand:- start:4330 stop:4518 length:189 start_codon:yes stop_codon:yes gene_type:complete
MVITALEQERMHHINALMNEFNDHHCQIYESLCDKEYAVTREAIDKLQIKLKSLSDSLQDEI